MVAWASVLVTRRHEQEPLWLLPLTLVLIPTTWLLLICWYVIAFGVFGLLTIPWRFLRRHQRKSLRVQQQQLELLRELQKSNRP